MTKKMCICFCCYIDWSKITICCCSCLELMSSFQSASEIWKRNSTKVKVSFRVFCAVIQDYFCRYLFIASYFLK